MTLPIINKLTTGAVAYLQTPEGDADYKERFPNDNETDIHRKAIKLLTAYINWRGRGSSGKWAGLADKLGLTKKEYKSAQNNFKQKVETAVNQLKQLAPIEERPTSNNVSNLSFFPFFCCCLDTNT